MVSVNLDKVTEFGKIKDIWTDDDDQSGLLEFVNNVVMNMNMFDEKNNNGYGIMLPSLSDIYVLVSTPDFPFDQIKNTHNTSMEKFSLSNKQFVLGYIWLCPWKLKKENYAPYHFIKFIDSRISGLNIAKYMIDKYEECDEECVLFPYEIDSKACGYWKKYLHKSYDIKSKNDLQKMITDFDFKTGDIKWDSLNELF